MQIERADGHTYRVWIHWWHPAFWLAAYDLFRHSSGRLTSAYLTLLLVRTMSRRKR